MLVDKDIILRVYMKIHLPNVYKYGAHTSLGNSLLSSLSLLVKSFEEVQLFRDLLDTTRD